MTWPQDPPPEEPGTPPTGPYQAVPWGQQPPPYPGQQSARPTNGLAIAALVCSLAGVVTLVTAPIGAILGHVARREIRRTGQEGGSLATAAIWVGWVLTGLAILGCCGLLAVWRGTTSAR